MRYIKFLFIFLFVESFVYAQDLSIGFEFDEPISTIKFQAISGNWNVNLYPFIKDSPQAIAASKMFREVNYEKVTEYMVPGEDIALMLVSKGIVARISSEKDVTKGFDSVVIDGGELISVEIPNKVPMVLQGIIQINRSGNRLTIINRLDYEQYVVSCASVISAITSEIEAIKAIILVVRTMLYYYLEHDRHPKELYNLCNKEHCMPFYGYGANRNLVQLLADKSKGQIITYKNKVIHARYHHTCGGKISSAQDIFGVKDEPYNLAHSDLKDNKGSENCFHSPSFHWVAEFETSSFLDFIAVAYAGGIEKFYTAWEPETTDKTGRITQILLRGRVPRHVTGYDFAERIHNHFGYNSLKSMRFTHNILRRSIFFKGMGYGDGVGMCLYGCDGLAKKGETADNIIRFYYPGTRIQKIEW